MIISRSSSLLLVKIEIKMTIKYNFFILPDWQNFRRVTASAFEDMCILIHWNGCKFLSFLWKEICQDFNMTHNFGNLSYQNKSANIHTIIYKTILKDIFKQINTQIFICINIKKVMGFCIPGCQALNSKVSEWRRLLFLKNITLNYYTCYSHMPHNNIFMNEQPYIPWWSHNIIIEVKNYCLVTL